MFIFAIITLIISAAFVAALMSVFIPAGVNIFMAFFRVIRAGLRVIIPMAAVGFSLFLLSLII